MNGSVCLKDACCTPPPYDLDGVFSASRLNQAASAVQTRMVLDATWKAVERFERDELLRYVDVIGSLVEQEEPIVQGGSCREELETLLAIGLIWQDEADNALDLANSALTRTATPRFRLILLTIVRYAFWKTRKLDAFYGLSMPRHYWGRPNMQVLRIINLSLEAAAEAEQLRLRLAERNARRALELAEEALGVNAHAALLSRCVLSAVAYEMGELEEAHVLIRGRDAAIDQYGSPDTALWGIKVASRIAIANDQRKHALLMIRRGQAMCRQRGWSRLRAHFEEQEIDLLVKEKNLVQARNVLERALQGDKSDVKLGLSEANWPLEAARLRVALAVGEYAEACSGFSRLSGWLTERNQTSSAVKFEALAAASRFQGFHQDEACRDLLKVLELGASAGLFRTFVDERDFIAPCLRRIRAVMKHRLGHLNAYINGILAPRGSVISPSEEGLPNHVAHSLSRREAVVLHLISKGYSNKTIARELYITPETVKSHIKRIALKLSTKTRAEAVALGKSVGII